MNEDVVTEKLAAAMWLVDIGDAPVKAPLSEQRPGTQRTYERAARALLPVVREIAAEELREAAEGLRGRAVESNGWTISIAGQLRARADALTKPPDGPVR